MNALNVRKTWTTTKGVWLRKTETSLVPWGDEAVKQLWSIKVGALGVGDIGGVRNPLALRLYWALVGVVAEALDVTDQGVHVVVKEALFEPELFKDVYGNERREYPSIALTAMPDAEFKSFLKLAIEMLSNMIGCAPMDLRQRFYDILDNDVKALMREGYLR